MFTPQSKYLRSPRHPNGHPGRVVQLDREEFWRLWREHEPYLLSLCVIWMKGNRDEAREALSGAMMRAVDGTTLGQLVDIGNMRAWLVRIVKNHCIDLLRQQSRLPLSMEEFDFLSGFADAILGHEVSPETGFLREEKYLYVLQALESLPEKLREVMMLRAYQDMPYKEIARRLCITPDTARKRAEQGRSLLNQRLSPDTNQARGPRSAHDAGIRPRTERRAADEILHRSPVPAAAPTSWAHLREVRLDDHRSIEAMVFLEKRPVRLGQKLKALERYMQRHPGGWAREKDLADLFFVEGQLGKAVKHYRSVLGRQPQLIGVAEDLFLCLRQLGRSTEALEVLQATLPFVPSDELRTHFLARIALQEGQLEMALAHWKEAARISGDGRRYLLHQMQALLDAGEIRRAGHLVGPLLHLEGLSDRETVQTCLRYAMLKGTESASTNLANQMVLHFPSDPTASAIWALRQMEQPLLAEGKRKQLSGLVKHLKPKLATTALGTHLVATWLYRQGKLKSCRKLVRAFTERHPGMREALMVGACWWERLGQPESASALLERKSELFDGDRSLPVSYLLGHC